jgi:hypothetical protein
VPDDTITESLRAISAQINLAINHLSPQPVDESALTYARYVASVCALLVTTLPQCSRYDFYEMMDVGMAIARNPSDLN